VDDSIDRRESLLLNSLWLGCSDGVNTGKIQTFKKCCQLGCGKPHHAILDAWPAKLAVLQPLGLTLSALLERKHQIVPEKGSPLSCSLTRAAMVFAPFLKSTDVVAIITRTGPGGISIPELMSALPPAKPFPASGHQLWPVCAPASNQ
jgi:hypothetical protein